MNTTCCVCKTVDFQQTSTQYSISYFDCAENFCDSCGFNEKKCFVRSDVFCGDVFVVIK